ncbi:hypothetical protein ACI5KX_14715 [Erythrobacter sp. GH1-10]|uniref:hypothetical protein n=1 Tax=Erythrobacter sp. GH1-10 TaxID=3349334 RepID=UPI003877B4E5
MNTKSIAIVTVSALALSACAVSDKEFMGYQDPTWGDANRATMAAQVINPNPEYDTLVPETSAQNAVNAIDRYREGTVEQPERISTTESIGEGPQ